MQVPNKALVVVVDGRKLLMFRNAGSVAHPELQVEHAQEQPNPKDVDQKTDQAGRAASTRSGPGANSAASGGSNHAAGGGAQFAAAGGTMGEADYHQQEEDRFAAETAELLRKRALTQDFEALIVVAPPRTLGELRKHYHKEVADRLVGELAKDLTGHPVPDIAAALAKA